MNKLIQFETKDFSRFQPKIFDLFSNQWLLLCSGNFAENKFNGMTISWGLMGTIWNRPIIMTLVRPQRYTKEFIDQTGGFSLCSFPQKYHQALGFCGSKSGRDVANKLVTSGLTPCAIPDSNLPACAEAELVITCKTLQSQELVGQILPSEIINSFYTENDFHQLYFGEVKAIFATPDYFRL